MSKKLSILICTIPQRSYYLTRLSRILEGQIDENVEVLAYSDTGKISIGEKRQLLLNKSIGEYVCFVDDDDLVSGDYVKLILNAIEQKPLVVGMHLLMSHNGILTGLTYHSFKYKTWYSENTEIPHLKKYYRNPNHLNPIRRDLAIKVGFNNQNIGEDKDYSFRLLPLLEQQAATPLVVIEKYIEKPIYFYEVREVKNI